MGSMHRYAMTASGISPRACQYPARRSDARDGTPPFWTFLAFPTRKKAFAHVDLLTLTHSMASESACSVEESDGYLARIWVLSARGPALHLV